MAERVLRNIQHLSMVRPGDRVGVGVSGGADSAALLLLLLELRKELGVVLSVVHFNHKLRGRASDADEKFVARLAEKHGLAFHVERADVKAVAKREKANLEDAARRARYGFFERLTSAAGVTRIAVAHTADDQAETVLAHILRGTGLAGLRGIHPTAGRVFRPLLGVRRAELRDYLRAKKQKWREDATNQDIQRLRARIRKRLLPLLEKQFQPATVAHLSSLAELAREDEEFLEVLARARCKALVRRNSAEARISVGDLLQPMGNKDLNIEDTPSAKKSWALSKRILRRVIEESKRSAGQITSAHISAVLGLAMQGQSGKKVQLPGHLEVRRDGEVLVFVAGGGAGTEHGTDKSEEREYEHKIELEGGAARVNVPELGCVFRLRVIDWPAKRGETKDTGAVLDRDRLHFPLVLRNWRPGDRLQPKGRQRALKLKRLLSEKRISRWEREGWPVLASGGVLVWARGFPVAAAFAANEGTRAGILLAEESL